MGLVMLFGSLVLFILPIVLAAKSNSRYYWVELFIVLLIAPLIVIPNTLPPDYLSTQNYPYKTEITLGNNGYQTSIYFTDFVQDDYNITINKYAFHGLHWTDFKLYNVNNTPIKITLKDNDGKFIYTDRQNNETFNYNIIATQP